MRLRWSIPLIGSLVFLYGCPTGGSDQDLLPPPPPPINTAIIPNNFLTFDNTYTVAGASQIDSAAYASAYNAAVDPNNRRTTMGGFKSINGFDSGVSAHITFRDSKDLGYGRDMYARRRPDGGMAIYVDNYLVAPETADATQYGPINLDAAIAQERRFHVTTNAIEFSSINESDPNSVKIVKMFTYGRPDENGEQTRLSFSDLDGRGDKAMPTPCFACHGGAMYPLDADGSFPLITLRSAKMNILDPITFEFAETTEAEQQVGIKVINEMIFDHYVEMDTRADTDQGKWANNFALELSAGPYGGDFSATLYDESFVPAGWRSNPDRPDGVETLFKEVVEPHCSACHSLRGNNSAEEYVDAPVGSVFDEAIDGDLSGDPLAPTAVGFSAGTNKVSGSMVGPEDVRDYLSFVIEPDQFLTSITLTQYFDVEGGRQGNPGYAHIDEGPTSVIPTEDSRLEFLGGVIPVSELIGDDLLALMADPGEMGGTGFVAPLGPGSYTFNIQQTGPELTGYSLDFEISGSAGGLANAITFSSYEKFISYNDDIINRVYRQGIMPASLLNFSRFWNNPAGPPSLLASFLQGFDVFDSSGNVTRPGRPVALPGADRTVTSPVVQDASASALTTSFAWQIVSSPSNSAATLSNANSSAVMLSGADGDYVLALTASNSLGSSTEQVTLTLDSALSPAPDQLDFATDIRAVLNTPGANRSCVSCHQAASEFIGIPVHFDDSNTTLYDNVLERVNFGDPENSVLLRKPMNLQHGGGIVLDRNVPEENAKFNTLLNWIRNGAPCGNDPLFCD